MRPAPILLTLALALASVGQASADRFSRPLCKKLVVEYADALALGANSDMEQGPEWAETNLPRERLENIDRLLNLEADLEFRCSMSRTRIAAIKPERKPVIPDIPERKDADEPQGDTVKAELEAAPAAKTDPPAVKAAAVAPGATVPPAKVSKGATAAIAPLAPPAASVPTNAKPVTAPTNGKAATVAPRVNPATAPAATPAAPPAQAAPATAPAAKPAAQPPAKVATQQAAPKPARTKKNKPNGYVSPRDVAPFGLYRDGSTW